MAISGPKSVILLAAALFLAAAPEVFAQRRMPTRAPGERPRRADKIDKAIDRMERRQMEVERLERMTPEQRQRVLDRLPPERRERVERGIENLRNMSEEDRARLREFRNQSPERREAMRKNLQRMQELPPPRRRAVRDEIQSLRDMSPEARAAHLDSEAFRKRFNQRERDLLSDVSRNMPE